MSTGKNWTRRQFSQALAMSAAGLALARPGLASAAAELAGLAFVGTATRDGSGDALHVFRVSDTGWQSLQTLHSTAPGHLLLHPALPVLYVLHDVAQWDHQPRGAVSTYAIHPANGTLTLRGTQPLSLAAIHPQHATLTASGSHLLVAAEHGGIYNLLPVASGGDLLPVNAIRKEFGLGEGDIAKIAAPGTVVAHRDGTLLAIDAGQESLTRFQMEGDALAIQHRLRVHAGHGPRHLALAPDGRHAYTLSAGGDAVAAHALHPGSSLETLQTLTVAPGRQSLLVAPGGAFLLAAGESSTEVLSIASVTGHLSRRASLPAVGQHVRVVAAGHLVGYNPSTGGLQQTFFEGASGTVAPTQTVARLDGGVSLAFRQGGFRPFSRRMA